MTGAPTPQAVRVGDVDVVALPDAVFMPPLTFDELAAGVPGADWAPYRERYPAAFTAAGPRYEINSYLIRDGERRILVDTGVGPPQSPMAAFFTTSAFDFARELPRELAHAGVRPEDVDTVVFTHLHPDHVGWNVSYEGEPGALRFPNARYVAHETEWATWHDPAVLDAFWFPFAPQLLTPLDANDRLELIAKETPISPHVTAVESFGHTPGSISVHVSSRDEELLIWGDVVQLPPQVTEESWMGALDMDPATLLRSRRRVFDWAETDGLLVASCHFPAGGFGHVVRAAGRRMWEVRSP